MILGVIEHEEQLKKEIVEEFKEYEIELKDVDIGGGADFWITIFVFSTMLFLSGKTINDNLNAWREIGNKIKSIFSKKSKPYYIDMEVAIALAIARICDKTEVKKIELKHSHAIIGKDINQKGFKLSFSPLDYYVIIFEVNNLENFIFCIKSNGKIRFQDYFEATGWNFEYNWDSYDKREDYTS